jgi:hypothetical protein
VAAEKRRVEEAASIAVIEKITKKCPGKPGQPCGWNIEKVAGCDHMTCMLPSNSSIGVHYHSELLETNDFV